MRGLTPSEREAMPDYDPTAAYNRLSPARDRAKLRLPKLPHPKGSALTSTETITREEYLRQEAAGDVDVR